MPRAFVSHSTADDGYVAEMKSFLHAAGFDEVFNDVSSILPDESFWPKIEEGITNCDSLVVVITAASNASDWVKREVELARSLSKKIIPIWIEDCEVPAMFDGRDVIDFRPRSRQQRHFDIGRIVNHAPAELIGREDETNQLNEAWQKTLRVEKGRPHILTFVALGGEGKTSLVAKWAAELASQDWPGCESAFAWSFYSQGTREQVAASSDLFLKEALNFFAEGDPKEAEIKAFAASPAGAFEKGQRLARIVGQRRSLLILDGLEPLQYAPTAPTPGQLKDQGITSLLRGLASASRGLCVVTTRYSLPDLRAFWQTTVLEKELKRLSKTAGVALLRSFKAGSEDRPVKIRGTQGEFEQLVEDLKGHALCLTLIGSYLVRIHVGDIRKRDHVKLEKADLDHHAFHIMDAYVWSLAPSGFRAWLKRLFNEKEREAQVQGRRAVAVLYLIGLFDRPADAGCLAALRREPIPGLTEPLAGLADDDWKFCLSSLEAAKLLTVNRDATGALVSLDAHPHLREYFAKQLREKNPDAWRAAHRRLYVHLGKNAPERPQPTHEERQSLCQAVAHGCMAGLHEKVFYNIYEPYLRRRRGSAAPSRLDALDTDLESATWFFDQPGNILNPNLGSAHAALLHDDTGFALRAMGRMADSCKVSACAIETFLKVKDMKGAARAANNVGQVLLALGQIKGAQEKAQEAVKWARCLEEPKEHWNQLMKRLATLGDILHQAGQLVEAHRCFCEAEDLLRQHRNEDRCLKNDNQPWLYSWFGFRHWDLLLSPALQKLWKGWDDAEFGLPSEVLCETESRHSTIYEDVRQRVEQSSQIEYYQKERLVQGMGSLCLAQTFLIEAYQSPCIQRSGTLTKSCDCADNAVDFFRRSERIDHIPRGLLTRAWLRFLTGAHTGPESAQEDLDEAWEIAERGPMRLHMADIHLYRARLFFREEKYPWESPAADLAAAEKLINECGYHRRDEELADAKAAILTKQP